MKLRIWQYFLLMVLLIVAIQAIGCSGTTTPAKPTAAPSAITAMEGYKVAEKEALAWNGDAALGYAMGLSIDSRGNQAPIDGTANTWLYVFESASARKKFLVEVTDGLVGTMYEHADNPAPGPDVPGDGYGVRSMAEWKVDSKEALQAALPAYEGRYGGSPAQARYILENHRDNSTGNVSFYWSITLYPEQINSSGIPAGTAPGNDSLTVYIDPANGTMLPQSPVVSHPSAISYSSYS